MAPCDDAQAARYKRQVEPDVVVRDRRARAAGQLVPHGFAAHPQPADAEDLVRTPISKRFGPPIVSSRAPTCEPGCSPFSTTRRGTAPATAPATRSRWTARPSSAPTTASTRGASAAAETPETLLLRDTLAPDLQAAVDALPERFRQALWLRDVEEFSYAEIAAMLSIPVGTVMSRISRGRRLLFDRLQPGGPLMSDCSSESIDPLITPYIDGDIGAAERQLVDAHARVCASCHSRLTAEQAVRDLLQARRHRSAVSPRPRCAIGAPRSGAAAGRDGSVAWQRPAGASAWHRSRSPPHS